jgi:hypothetical protein
VIRSRGSSGSIVSDYGLDDWVIEVRSPTGAEDFSSSLCIQTGSGAHLPSYPMVCLFVVYLTTLFQYLRLYSVDF